MSTVHTHRTDSSMETAAHLQDPERPVHDDPFVALFSESTARVLVTTTDDRADALVALAQRYGTPITPLGRTGGDTLAVEGVLELSVAEAKAAWRATLPAALGH